MPRLASTFAIAHTDLSAQPFNNAARTVRIFIPNNLSGNAVYIRFSNPYADRPVWVGNASIALSDSRHHLIPDSIHPLTVNGESEFALCPGHELLSDRIEMAVEPGMTLAVSLYYPGGDKVTSGNFVGLFASRSVKGDHCCDAVLPKARLWSGISKTVLPWDITSATTTLSEVIVEQSEDAPAPRVVAMFGDSIMQQGTWVTPITARLYERFRGEISVVNLGIGGNRLLHDASAPSRGLHGQSGMSRFDRDVLSLHGLTHVVFALGTNDIGHPGTPGVPESELISVDDYASAVCQIADTLHKRGVKVYAGLLLPREVNLSFPQEREELRLALNRWISEEGPFDAVIDLGAPIADLQDGIGMKREYAMPDGLHPNLAGGKLIADAIDLDLFA